MNDRKYLLDTIKALNKLKQQLKSTHEKILEKAFIKANSHYDINFLLQNYTKSDLNIIRKCLGVSCVSTLKKNDLAAALSDHVKASLKALVKRLTESEYKLIKYIVRNSGIVPYNEKYSDIALYLRKLGLLSLIIIDDNKFMIVPKDIVDEIYLITNTIEVYQKIKTNEVINQLLRGMLYYYGVLDFSTAYRLISKYIDNYCGDMFSMMSIIYENYWKDYGIFICDDYLCYDFIDDYHDIIAEQQSLIKDFEYKIFTKNELFLASQNELCCLNNHDLNFIDYLTANYEISKREAEELTWEIKLDIKNCYDFNEILCEIEDCFTYIDSNQQNELKTLVQKLYTNCNQWVLKGFSYNEINEANGHYTRSDFNTKNNFFLNDN